MTENNRPVIFHLAHNYSELGDRSVRICPPGDKTLGGSDVDIDLINGEPRICLSGYGIMDTFGSADFEEARRFSWEVLVASIIAEHWDLFWTNPRQFLERVANPYGYTWQIQEIDYKDTEDDDIT